MNHKARLSKLEAKHAEPAAVIAWAELIAGRAVLRYQDGQRVEAAEADIPPGVKVYAGFSPDDWDSELLDLATARPSNILARADALIEQGTQPTPTQRAAMESIRKTLI